MGTMRAQILQITCKIMGPLLNRPYFNKDTRFFAILPPMRSVPTCFRAVPVLFSQWLVLFLLIAVAHASSTSDRRELGVDLIPESLVDLNWNDGLGHALVVEKASQTISVYECKDGFPLKHRFPCSTGEAPGKKETSGDRRTPEGIYFFTKAFKKRYLSPTYGNRAFVMDYPNLLDRRHGRDGNSIWLHGTNKPLKPRDSNGCIVTKNDHIDTLARYIRLNRTPIIIKKKLHMVSPERHSASQQSVSAFLEAWKSAFATGDRAKYSACYDEPPAGTDGLWDAWNRIRTAWQHAEVPFHMSLGNMTIARANPCVVALFDEVLHLDHHTTTVGTKKLFLEPDGSTLKIIGEVYQPAASNPESTGPMVTSLVRLDRLQKDYKTVAELIAEWADAWRSKDIERYRACYADDFYARKMDLKAWIRYKEKLNRYYDTIEVSIENLEISQESDRGTATFLQRYDSSGNHSVGIKRLSLKRVEGLWRIYRETWRKMRT
jgi:murein L,D-transpeptidase YafK